MGQLSLDEFPAGKEVKDCKLCLISIKLMILMVHINV